MAQVYGGAFLTISAALARDVSHGMLNHGRRRSEDNETTADSGAVEVPLYDEPLYTRAWALQERILSAKILIFGTNDLYWDCRNHEDGRKPLKAKETGRAGRLSSSRLPVSPSFRDWHLIVTEYSGRIMTFESDKLPAVAGLAAVYQQATGDEYVAGLWRSSLIVNLLWKQQYLLNCHQSSISVPREYRAPSWSWASFDGNIEFALRGRPQHFPEAEILGTYLDSIEELSVPIGQFLWIRGPLFEVNINNDRVYVSDGELGAVWMDVRTTLLHEDQFEFKPNAWCVILATDQGERFGLILHRKKGVEDRSGSAPDPIFERIGYFITTTPRDQDFIPNKMSKFFLIAGMMVNRGGG
ncbi:hypothetical protein G7Y89_g5199 [Cudoniella acicularis]|uniref:Heterokaryon incompatibility domain-containing protein n=1 Tax=Cudoniella acicularis TaxID=354080 RepID=A0A8H4RQ43_9HELO|nr:hypothetical protein G7Y89_g5199 [Cudoniella acicularis]